MVCSTQDLVDKQQELLCPFKETWKLPKFTPPASRCTTMVLKRPRWQSIPLCLLHVGKKEEGEGVLVWADVFFALLWKIIILIVYSKAFLDIFCVWNNPRCSEFAGRRCETWVERCGNFLLQLKTVAQRWARMNKISTLFSSGGLWWLKIGR